MSMDAAVRPITRVRRSICWNIRYSRRSATAAIMRGRLMPLVNAMHRVLNRSGVRLRLHPVAAHPHTVAFGTSRVVPPNTTMVCFEAGQYSVPHTLLGETVWVRVHGRGADEQVIIVHVGPNGPAEVARHARATPGSPQVSDAHFPAQPAGALDRNPRARNATEAQFLALGEGARLWLVEAAAAGTTKMRVKIGEALALATLFGATEVDWRSATPRCTAGSPRPTWPPSSTTTPPALGPAIDTKPVRTAPSPWARPPGPSSVNPPRRMPPAPVRARSAHEDHAPISG
jgi:hypothetical protein